MKSHHLLKIFILLLILFSWISVPVRANDLNWSGATIAPLNETTIRAYGFQYAPTPKVLYNIDFVFNEETQFFEPDMSTLFTISPNLYAQADLIRGGLLYDKWWKINEEAEPIETYEGYPEIGTQTGSTTWRCQECHGWDYQGNDGAYESGDHYTGIEGLYTIRKKTAAEIYEALLMKDLLLSEQDLWDLTKFIKEGLLNMNKYIIFSGTQSKSATGDIANGQVLYEGKAKCSQCHGADGKKISSVSVGDVTRDNPWKSLHKIRFGQPSTKMPSAIKNGLSLPEQIDILTYAQTLSQN